MNKFLVIDTETTWENEIMSIGAVIADSETMCPIEKRYYIIDPTYRNGGKFSFVLMHPRADKPIICTRSKAMNDLLECGNNHNIQEVFAYNASFDKAYLPELANYHWHDIMRLAAYRQYNATIPASAPLCSTGRLKSGYGVEPVLRMLTGNQTYRETHNALLDALDELKIMALLGHPVDRYI